MLAGELVLVVQKKKKKDANLFQAREAVQTESKTTTTEPNFLIESEHRDLCIFI